MIPHYGRVAVDSTVYVPFHTFDSNDPSASVTITGLAVTDIEIYKNGSVTQRSSDAGYTLLDTDGIDFDGTTGLHGFSIDLSDNTDAGFFSSGAFYMVAVAAITVDAATINFWACTFFIGGDGAALLTDTEAILTDSEAILADSEAILTDSEAILADTEASQTAETAILADTEASQTAETAILADTEAAITSRATLLTDTEALLVDTEAIVADTNELQTDWTDAGRLDAILDAVLVDTEAAVTDTEAILTDSEAILTDSEAILTDVEAQIATTISGSCEGTPTTTSIQTDLAEATDDHFKGRVVVFTSGAVKDQATDITGYTGATGTLAVTALTNAPAAADTFVIL